MLVATKYGHRKYRWFCLLAITSTSIQYFDPLQHLPYILFVRSYVTDDPGPNRARNAHSKFQATPATCDEMFKQLRPGDARFGNEHGRSIRLLFNMIVWQADTRYNSAHTGIGE